MDKIYSDKNMDGKVKALKTKLSSYFNDLLTLTLKNNSIIFIEICTTVFSRSI